MKERINTIASVLAVESGVITTEDMRYGLAATLRHIDDVDFLRTKNASTESSEALIEHLIGLISKKLKGVGIQQSRIKQDVLNSSKPAKDNAKAAKLHKKPSFYDQALEIMFKNGSVVYEQGTKKLMLPVKTQK
jgi:hypothetical protein